MAVLRRLSAVTLVIAVGLTAAFVAGSAGADELGDARQRLAEAKAAANAATVELNAAKNQLAALDNHIAEIEQRVADQRARAEELSGIARRRALYAYKHASEGLDVFVDAGNPVEVARRTQLLEQANENDNRAVRQLAAINADLKQQEGELRAQRAQQVEVQSQLEAANREVQERLAAAQRATEALEQKLAEEQARASAAAAARIAAERALLNSSRSVGGVGPGTVIVNPGDGSFMCPVSGAVYTNDFGGARNHQGIDMFVPTGTPEVAVKAGSVTYVGNEGAGGNAAYLYANDGNVYYYAHMSSFAGGNRSVSQGEILGLAGMTGNASAPHLHFEIRLGGPNGQRINPYPTLKAAGC